MLLTEARTRTDPHTGAAGCTRPCVWGCPSILLPEAASSPDSNSAGAAMPESNQRVASLRNLYAFFLFLEETKVPHCSLRKDVWKRGTETDILIQNCCFIPNKIYIFLSEIFLLFRRKAAYFVYSLKIFFFFF